MIEGLFNRPNYVAAKKALDAVELRHQALSSNIANVETPGYKRLDVAPSFTAEFQRALATGNAQQIDSIRPQLAVDSTAISRSPDGNTVNLEHEMLELNQNSMAHALETQLISSTLLRLRLAITGRPS